MSDRMTKAYDDSNGAIEFLLPKLDLNLDWPPEPDTLFIHMTRGERRVRESVNKAFGNIKYVIIDVDGEKHDYDADTLIALLEEFEVRDEIQAEHEQAICTLTGELLTCPFCAGEAETRKAKQDIDGTWHPASCGCPACGLFFYGDISYGHNGFADSEDYDKSLRQAIERWNTRKAR